VHLSRKIKNNVKRYEENLNEKDKETKKMTTKFLKISCPAEVCTMHNTFHIYGLVSLQYDC
jgi:ABC-type Zn uptake system ZnuABC Zn-binding protein ZnuA